MIAYQTRKLTGGFYVPQFVSYAGNAGRPGGGGGAHCLRRKRRPGVVRARGGRHGCSRGGRHRRGVGGRRQRDDNAGRPDRHRHRRSNYCRRGRGQRFVGNSAGNERGRRPRRRKLRHRLRRPHF